MKTTITACGRDWSLDVPNPVGREVQGISAEFDDDDADASYLAFAFLGISCPEAPDRDDGEPADDYGERVSNWLWEVHGLGTDGQMGLCNEVMGVFRSGKAVDVILGNGVRAVS